MGALDQVKQMKQMGLSEQEISNRLFEQGITQKAITDAFSQAKIKDNLEKIRRFIESVSTEFSKFARKDDLDILIKQAKMFQPLRYLKENAE